MTRPSKRELWREVEQLDKELPLAGGGNGDGTNETIDQLHALFDDDETFEEFAETAEKMF